MGVLLIVLGCCGMIRMDAIIAKKDICFGMITLCMGILTLQSAIQLNALQNKYWMWDMAAAFVLILCSVFVITDTTILVHKRVIGQDEAVHAKTKHDKNAAAQIDGKIIIGVGKGSVAGAK